MNCKRFASVWDAIEDSPEEAENIEVVEQIQTAV